jgi:arginine/ornithine transport system substrate-binding protein
MQLGGRLALALAALMLLGGQAAQAAGQALRIGVDGTYPPFSEVAKGGEFSGFDVEIAKALCEHMEVECRLVALDNWATVMPDLNAGKYDAVVASMSITPERQQRVDFTKKYYHAPAVFIARKGTVPSFSEEAMKGRKVGVQRSTTHDGFLAGRYGGHCEITRFDTLGKALDALVAGEVELVMADSLALQKGFLQTRAGRDFAIVGPSFTDPYWFGSGNGIALPKGSADLKARFDRAIDALLANGTYKTIASRYFPFDIYGGQ